MNLIDDLLNYKNLEIIEDEGHFNTEIILFSHTNDIEQTQFGAICENTQKVLIDDCDTISEVWQLHKYGN